MVNVQKDSHIETQIPSLASLLCHHESEKYNAVEVPNIVFLLIKREIIGIMSMLRPCVVFVMIAVSQFGTVQKFSVLEAWQKQGELCIFSSLLKGR